VEQRCWQVFDDQLAGFPWAKTVAMYQATRALLQADHLEKRFASFAAANQKRLTAHFGAAVDRAVAAYMANRSTIFMPATEEDVEVQHSAIAAATRELLLHAAADLTDTSPFAAAQEHLNLVIKEGYQQVKDKNIELWKVHSDEATRCAAASNRVAERACGVVCLFSSVPWYHKAVTRRHLSDCFTKSAIAQQMATPLRQRVFEAWYAKDLVRETSRVSTKFTICLAILFIIIGALWWQCRPRGPPIMQNGYYVPPMPGSMQAPMGNPAMFPQAQFQRPAYQAGDCYGYGQSDPGLVQRRGFGIFHGGA